ncbi:hypothetical protein, partial [Methanocalculus sp.]|uniref:glycosyltransferase n=1 Tax=Methanocalculus sp. TaxID=2004547 RepID=UPI0026134331
AADVVILPYTDILSSGAALLALSFGKPIIAPAIGCIPQVLDNHGSILYDPDQEEGMINAMKSIKKCNLSDMGKHNYQKSKDLNWDLVGKMTASELSKLIQ